MWWLDRWGLSPNEVAEIDAHIVARAPEVARLVDEYREEQMRRERNGHG